MKILHTADWHLGKKLEGFSRLQEQADFLVELQEIADREAVDCILIAGDIYDHFNPPNEAISLFFDALRKLSNGGRRAVVAIAGNHDSTDRIAAPHPLAQVSGIVLIGDPFEKIAPFETEHKIAVSQSDYGFVQISVGDKTPINLIHTAYANEARLRTYFEEGKTDSLRDLLRTRWQDLADSYFTSKGINLLMAHLFVVGEGGVAKEEADDEKPILYVGGAEAIYSQDFPNETDYVALGHLHRPHSVPCSASEVCYAGSPVSYSFSEANQQKSVVLLDFSAGKMEKRQIPISSGKKLLRGKFQDVPSALAWLEANQNALVEITLELEAYLTASDRQMLHAAHSGIVHLIPQLQSAAATDLEGKRTIDLSQDLNALFEDYFEAAKGAPPTDTHLDIFKEILNSET